MSNPQHPDDNPTMPSIPQQRTDEPPTPHRPRVPTVVPERHLYKIPDAMALLSLSRSVIYEEIRADRLQTVMRGRSRLVPAQAITAYVELLMTESGVSFDETP